MAVLLAGLLGLSACTSSTSPKAPTLENAEAAPLALKQAVGLPWPQETSDLPPDPELRFDRLANGLRIAWRPHQVPPGSCSLRLIVHAGSREEQDDERGIAHFVEHMAFNGTRRFPGTSIVDWFQQKGMAFGRDVNAHTSFLATTYEIDLPHVDAVALTEGLEVLADFALGLVFDPSEVANEQAVIDAEERERSSPEATAREEWKRRSAAGCRVAERSPIGVREDRVRFTADRLRAFHARWYRPDNMTLVAVGDFGSVDVVSAARSSLGSIPLPVESLPERPDLGQPEHIEQCFRVVQSEREHVDYRVQCTHLQPPHPQDLASITKTAALGIACDMADWLFAAMSTDRASPVRHITVRVADSWSGSGAITDGVRIDFACVSERREEALAWVARALVETQARGFAQEVFDAVQTDVLAHQAGHAMQLINEPSPVVASRLTERLADGEVPTTGKSVIDRMSAAVRQLDVDACRAAFEKAWAWPTSITSIEPNAPAIDARALWDAALQAARTEASSGGIADAAKGNLTPPDGAPTGPTVPADDPKGWSYATNAEDGVLSTDRSHDARLDVEDVHFANGVRLLLKRTTFAAKEVQLAVCIGNGQRQIGPNQLAAFEVHRMAFDELGLTLMLPGRLQHWCTTNHTRVSWRVEPDRFEFTGTTDRADLRFACELLAAHCHSPGWRTEAMDYAGRQIAGRDERARHSFTGTRQDFGRRIAGERDLSSEADLRAVTLDAMRDVVEPLLASAPLTVVIVGDFDPDETIALVGRTFGRLAARKASTDHHWQCNAIATGVHEDRVVDTTAPKSEVSFYVRLPAEDLCRALAVRLLPVVLHDRMRIRLREQLGEAYAPGVAWGEVQGEATTSFILGLAQCATGHERAVLDACIREVVAAGADGITDAEFQRARALVMAAMDEARSSNAGWLDLLIQAHVRADGLDLVATSKERLGEVTLDAIRAAAKAFLRADTMSTLILRPKTDR